MTAARGQLGWPGGKLNRRIALGGLVAATTTSTALAAGYGRGQRLARLQPGGGRRFGSGSWPVVSIWLAK